MPPVRTLPVAKPVKTERTHEENQERAYIAASRRSDRSLEARVESARRASEIHKRRTGRSLRVTEQDVVNEEMYEEEDDDLPMQYRRLTAHLQTTNVDFDRRLAAYLTNHVAMRTALGQAVSDSYAHQQYPNAPQFANQMSQFPQGAFPNPMAPPQMVSRSPQSFRQAPYPQTNPQAFRPNGHGRSSSIATPQELQQYPTSQSPVNTFKPELDRRMSLPVQTPTTTTQSLNSPVHNFPDHISSTSSSSSNLANLKHEAAQQGYYKNMNSQTGSPKKEGSPQLSRHPQMRLSNFPPPFTIGGYDPTMTGMPNVPFSMALPNETQQLLGSAFDPNDSFTSMLMGNQESRNQQPFYSYNPNPSSKSNKGHNPPSNFEGMNQTLAPGMLDTTMTSSTPSGPDSAMTPQDGFGNFGYNSNFMESFKAPSNSGLNTPGEQDWANLIDANAWEDSSPQAAFA